MKKLILTLVGVLLLTEQVFAVPYLVKSGGKVKGDDGYGHLLHGWHQIDTDFDGEGEYYYFDMETGELVTDTFTEDGWYVGTDGKWDVRVNNARDYNTEGFKIRTSLKDMFYNSKDRNVSIPMGRWALISFFNDNVYNWYYFDYNGTLVTNKSDVQGKYKVDKKGRWVQNNEVVEVFLADNEKTSDKLRVFEDSTGAQQSGVIYSEGAIISNKGEEEEASVYYAVSPTKTQTFLSTIDKDQANNCNFEIEDRYYFNQNEVHDDHYNKTLLKNTIVMQSSSSSFRIKTTKYNSFKLTYALEYKNAKPNADSTASTEICVYNNGVLIDIDEDLYEDVNRTVRVMEFTVKQGNSVLITYKCNNANMNLLIAGQAKRVKNYDEEEDVDSDYWQFDNEDIISSGPGDITSENIFG